MSSNVVDLADYRVTDGRPRRPPRPPDDWSADDEAEFQRQKAAGLINPYVHDGDDSDLPF
jgi:hypothetical protein